MRISSRATQFDWDAGNRDKNKLKHGVAYWEYEEAFFDTHKVTLKDALHSDREQRYILLGKTKQGRLLFVVFTIRGSSIRVISACDLTKRKEIDLYEQAA